MEKSFCNVVVVNGEKHVQIYSPPGSLERFCSVCLSFARYCQEDSDFIFSDECFAIMNFLFEESDLSDLFESFLSEVSKLG